jgi:hypothetical protein
MDRFFNDFKEAYGNGDGYGLSMTLSPLDPPSKPNKLSSFYRSTNVASAVKDFRYRILYDNSTPFRLSHEEGNGWVDIYFAYWKAVGEILNVENTTQANEKVSKLSSTDLLSLWMLEVELLLFSSGWK